MKNSRRNFLRNTALGVSSIPALGFINKSSENQSLEDISRYLDNSDQILKILSKSRSNEEKHIVLFNLPEVLKA